MLEGLFQRIYAKFKGQTIGEDPVEEMIKISGAPVLVPRMPFGKHKGLKMAEVPKDYLQWFADTSELRLPIHGAACTGCGLVQGEGNDSCWYYGTGLSPTIQ